MYIARRISEIPEETVKGFDIHKNRPTYSIQFTDYINFKNLKNLQTLT